NCPGRAVESSSAPALVPVFGREAAFPTLGETDNFEANGESTESSIHVEYQPQPLPTSAVIVQKSSSSLRRNVASDKFLPR
ncbi:MAG TPA: hypothetical protein VGE93_05180, partial [Bryobacteraceae bacterium]